MDRRALMGSENGGFGGFQRSGPDGMWRWRNVRADRISRRRALLRTGAASLALIIVLGVVAVAVVRLGGGPVNPEAGLVGSAAGGSGVVR